MEKVVKVNRILILANNDVGLYKFRKELINELAKKSEIYLSLPIDEYAREFAKLGYHLIDTKIDRRGINPFKDIKLLFKYWEIVKKIKPDYVLAYTIKPNIYGGIICRLKNIKYAVNITGLGTAFNKNSMLKKFVIFMYKVSLKRAHVVFFENEENLKIFTSEGIITKEQGCKMNGAGVNLYDYKFTPYPKDSKNIRFLFIGRLMKEKGINEFIEVAKRVKASNDDIQFDIVGPYEEAYHNQINELASKKIINYYGYQKDVRPYIKDAFCFVLPSYHEGMANTLLECGAMGRPLITSDIPGCREAVESEVNGYLVEVASANDLYDKICNFINLSYEDKRTMGMNSRFFIEEHFDKLSVVNKTIVEITR